MNNSEKQQLMYERSKAVMNFVLESLIVSCLKMDLQYINVIPVCEGLPASSFDCGHKSVKEYLKYASSMCNGLPDDVEHLPEPELEEEIEAIEIPHDSIMYYLNILNKDAIKALYSAAVRVNHILLDSAYMSEEFPAIQKELRDWMLCKDTEDAG